MHTPSVCCVQRVLEWTLETAHRFPYASLQSQHSLIVAMRYKISDDWFDFYLSLQFHSIWARSWRPGRERGFIIQTVAAVMGLSEAMRNQAPRVRWSNILERMVIIEETLFPFLDIGCELSHHICSVKILGNRFWLSQLCTFQGNWLLGDKL